MPDTQTQALEENSRFEFGQDNPRSWNDSLMLAKKYIERNIPVILYGPPGTGKTKLVYDLVEALKSEDNLGRFESVQFHKKFSYEDFIEGYAPGENGNFIKKDGIFKNFCKNPSEKKVDLFLIDEINRAEITTTFGELLFLLEDRDKRSIKTSHFSEELSIPNNISIIGTMNTADRNIAILDYALRRRFVFIPVFPDYDVLLSSITKKGFSFDAFSPSTYVNSAKIINKRISKNRLMGRNMQFGHTMFMVKGEGEISEGDIIDLFSYIILPQLEAYCGYGYEDQISQLLNPNLADKYLKEQKIIFDDIVALITDLSNEYNE